MNQTSNITLPKSSALEKAGYGLIGFGQQFVWTFCAMYITQYYTNSLGVAAAAVGTMMLVSRLLDGVSDVICAWMFKKCNFKTGKIRTWFFISAPLLAISIIAMLNTPVSLSNNGKLAYVAVTYCFTAAVSYTITNLAWSAILPIMSYDDQDRVKISSTGMLFVYGGIMLLGVTTPFFLALFGGMTEPGSWGKMSFIYAAAVFLTHIVGGLLIKEKEMPVELLDTVASPTTQQFNFGQILKAVLTDKYTWFLLALFVCFYLSSGAAAINAYLYMYVFGDMTMAIYGKVGTISTLVSLVGIIMCPFLIGRFGKKRTLVVGLLLCIGCKLLAYLATTRMILYIVLQALSGLFMAPAGATVYTFIADLTDRIDRKNGGMQATEVVSMCSSVGTKVGTGLGSALVGWLTAAIGLDFAEVVQTAAVLNGIVHISILLPVIGLVVVAIMIAIWDPRKD